MATAPDLVLSCIERCGAAVHVPFKILRNDSRLVRELRGVGWFLSVVTPPGGATGKPALAPLCDQCAPKVHHPEVLARARAVLDENSTSRGEAE